MNDEHTELERQVGQLTVEVIRLRRIVLVGFVVLGVVLVLDRDSVMVLVAVGVALWIVARIGAALGSAAARRSHQKEDHDIP